MGRGLGGTWKFYVMFGWSVFVFHFGRVLVKLQALH